MIEEAKKMSENQCQEVRPMKPGVYPGRDESAELLEVVGLWEAYAAECERATATQKERTREALTIAFRCLRQRNEARAELKRHEECDWPGWARDIVAERDEARERLEKEKALAVSLLMDCVPHLDLRVSDHKDGDRLRRRICQFLGRNGYPGWFEQRYASECVAQNGDEMATT